MKKYTITALVSNKSGVLTRISGLFARRGFNIDSLCVCATEMTKQMDKLIDVKKIALAKEEDSVLRELLLIKVSVPAEKRSEIIEIKDVYKAKIVDLSPDSLVLEITGDPNKLDGFIGVIRPYGILEMARTGVTALARGDKKLKDELDYNEMI